MSEDTSHAVEVEEVEVAEPKHVVSALLWESFFGKPFSLEDKAAYEQQQVSEVKIRGRPRKHNLPVVEGKTVHKMSDEEVAIRKLLPESIKKMVMDFKEYIEEGKSPKFALEQVAKLYNVPYCQAFNICADEY